MANFAVWCVALSLAFGSAGGYGQVQTSFQLDKPAAVVPSGGQQLLFKLEKPRAGIVGARVFLSDSTTASKPGTYIGRVSFYPSDQDGPIEFALPLKSIIRSASVLKITPIRQSGAKGTSQKLVVMKAAIVPVDNSSFR